MERLLGGVGHRRRPYSTSDASCSLWDQVLCEGRSQGKNHPRQVRQYNSGVLSESQGGYKVSNMDRDGLPGVGMVPSKEHNQCLPGLENVRADFLSRYLTDRTDWHLNPTIFQAIDRLWGPLEVDLFATRLTAQLPRFFSWRPDPEAEAVDQNQGFCSSAMVAHSLTPTTYTAPERNLGLHCSSVANTVMVPYSTVPVDRLTSPSSTLSEHDPAIPQLRQPPTAVTTATGCMEGLQQQFAAQGIPQEHLSCHPGDRKQTPTTTQLGESGNSGVMKELSIPFQHLSQTS